MAIINKNVQIIFGTGDIAARIGCMSEKTSGVVQFIEIEPKPIGEELISEEKTMDIAEAPVTFIFNKIESIDAVIYQLQKLKGIMSKK